MDEKMLTEKESLDLIAQMINKARNAYYNTGISAILWGAVISFCAFEKFAEIQFGYRLPFDIYLLTFAAIVPQILISIKERKARVVKSYDEPFMRNIWVGFGICIALLIFIINVVFNHWIPAAHEYKTLTGHDSSFNLNEYIASFFLILYGLPTFITGAACGFKPMIWGGLLCWACCIITAFTNVKIDMILTAVSAIGAWLLPGLILKQAYGRAKLKLKEANV